MDLSFSEVMVICVVAFLVFGPEEFIRKVNKLGLWLGRMKTHANNFKVMLESEIHDKNHVIDDGDSAVDKNRTKDKPNEPIE